MILQKKWQMHLTEQLVVDMRFDGDRTCPNCFSLLKLDWNRATFICVSIPPELFPKGVIGLDLRCRSKFKIKKIVDSVSKTLILSVGEQIS